MESRSKLSEDPATAKAKEGKEAKRPLIERVTFPRVRPELTIDSAFGCVRENGWSVRLSIETVTSKLFERLRTCSSALARVSGS